MEEPQNRECKTCKTILPLTSFDKSYNIKCITPCYRWDCPPCLRNKRKTYLKDRHAKTYIKKGRPTAYKPRIKKVHHCNGCNCDAL